MKKIEHIDGLMQKKDVTPMLMLWSKWSYIFVAH